MLQALVFDVDGTLADTEAAHLAAFNQAFAEDGLDWHWSEAAYTRLLEISGGKERILHYWRSVQPDLVDLAAGVRDTVARLHSLKTAYYESAVQQGAVQLRAGVLAMIEQAHQAGLKMAIATTTSPVNISTLLRQAIGDDWRHYFAVVEDARTDPRTNKEIVNRGGRCPQRAAKKAAPAGLPANTCTAQIASQRLHCL